LESQDVIERPRYTWLARGCFAKRKVEEDTTTAQCERAALKRR